MTSTIKDRLNDIEYHLKEIKKELEKKEEQPRYTISKIWIDTNNRAYFEDSEKMKYNRSLVESMEANLKKVEYFTNEELDKFDYYKIVVIHKHPICVDITFWVISRIISYLANKGYRVMYNNSDWEIRMTTMPV